MMSEAVLFKAGRQRAPCCCTSLCLHPPVALSHHIHYPHHYHISKIRVSVSLSPALAPAITAYPNPPFLGTISSMC